MTGGDNGRPQSPELNRRTVLGLTAVAIGGGAVLASRFGSNDSSPQQGPEEDSTVQSGQQSGVSPTYAPTAEVSTVVADDGFDVTIGSVRVFGPSGVAEPGMPLVVATTSHPEEADDFTTPVGEYIHIRLGDGDQPQAPITIVFDLSGTEAPSRASSETPVVAFATIDGIDIPLLMEGSFDPQTGHFTVVTEHLSGFGTWLADLNKAFLQFMWELMGLTFTQPACAYNSASLGGTTYSVPEVGNDHLWPCLTSKGNEVRLELHSNSILSWKITSTPGAAYEQDSEFLSPHPALARIYQAGYAAFGKDRYVLMPGSAAVLRYEATDPPQRIEMDFAPGLQIFVNLFFIVHKTVETFLKFVGGELMPSVLDHFACFIDLVRSLNKLTDEGKWVSLITAGLSCLKARLEAGMPEMVEMLMRKGIMKVGGQIAAKAIAISIIALISLLISAASALTAVILGGLYTALKRDDFSFAIAASGDSTTSPSGSQASNTGPGFPMPTGNAASTHEMPGPAPRLDRPVVVHWKFDSIQTHRTQRMIVSEGGLYLNRWGGDHATRADLLRLDAATGKERWRLRLDGEVSSPVVSNGLVIVGQSSASSQPLIVLEAETGKRQWEMTDPIVGWMAYEGSLYVSGVNFVRSIDLSSGEKNWESATGISGGITIANDIVVVTDGYYGDHHAFHAGTGSSLWAISVSARLSGLAAMADGFVIVSDRGGRLFGLNAETGETQWTWESGFGTSAFIEVITAGAVYVTSGGLLHKIDIATGNLLWKFTGNDTIWPVVVIDDLAYAGDVSGMMYMIDAGSGEQQWSHYVGEVAKETPTVVDGVVYCEYGGTVYAIGNLPEAMLSRATTLRGTPARTAVTRGEAAAGTRIDHVGGRRRIGGEQWVQVIINGTDGWILLEEIDPATLPPEGEIDYVYIPE